MTLAAANPGVAGPARFALRRLQAYYTLCKPRVVVLMLFTALVGEVAARPHGVPFNALVWGNLGIGLCAAGAAAINHIIDRRIDARMSRTARRPLPKGAVGTLEALGFALSLSIAGFIALYTAVNPLTAWLTLAALLGYALVYTGFLKRATSQNIVIGGLAGAAPPLLGWTAVTGQVDVLALQMVAIIFVWTPPHFWPLALYKKSDYAEVGIPMLPITHGEDHTRWQILFYTILLVMVSALPTISGYTGWLYLSAALLLGARFAWHALLLLKGANPKAPMRMFTFSITYLFLLFAALLADLYL